MRKLRALEDLLIQVESALAVVLVLTMLLLAAYNVVYRNVLVPLQNHWAHSGPPVEPAPVVEAAPAKTDATPVQEAKTETANTEAKEDPVDSAREGGADDFGGFGGGLGEEDEGEAKAETKAVADAKSEPEKSEPEKSEPEKSEPEKSESDDFGGFGGGLDDEPEAAPSPPPAPSPPARTPATVALAEPTKSAKSESDGFGGFGGGLGDEEPEDAAPDATPSKAAGDDFGGFGGGLDDGGDATKPADAKAPSDAKAAAADEDDDLSEDELDGEDDLGDDDQFANLADIDKVAKQTASTGPQGGPPPEGSFAAWAIQFIDDVKLDWIDVFLRQLVIIVAFFGAMLATQRGKHINVDALSKMLPRGLQRVVGVLLPLAAVAVCLVLARAGWDLVQISRQYPKDLLPSVPEWSLQLMFPVGFGLLAVHFVVRIVEAVAVGPVEPEAPPRRAAPPPVDEADDDEDAAASKGGSR